MSSRITALDAQHDSTAVDTESTHDVDESAAPTFGTGDDVEEVEAIFDTCLALSCGG